MIILPEPMWICCWHSLMKRESSLSNNPVHPLRFALLPLPAHREFWLPQSAASAFLSQSHNGNLCIYVPVPARIHAGIQKQITPFVEEHLFKRPQFLAGQKAKLLFRPVTFSILIIRVIVFHVGHSNGMKKTPEFILDSMGGKGKKGCTVGQYEKQSFWANRDWGNYPEPERHNPDRNIAPELEVPTHSRIEHER